ncbi:DUF6415 family natural product biosynthesis protein [Streptomyces sp. H27-D2]|uniref:DUF6415 family natural product biosynthesis protein n=1 Tax=Streptomyces sp. H27-D2 TaxID=3046304 RepID=UPI002DBE3594|nr:DUF6415 family natural product biosynthesis protein [Streptomyces sp. H27-D2]MEC4018074.1 DUF6415 family natural product biosynthesis protein [Streptomyces sp. H27-D2]
MTRWSSDAERPIRPTWLSAEGVIDIGGAGRHDRDAIQKTISHSLTERSAPLRCEELAELEQLLRDHIHLLLPEVEAKVDRMWHGGREWYRHRARLGGIRRQVGHGLGAGLFSAQRQVHQLARDCRWLLEQHPDA